ncbi:MAG: branched-chain amino acid ABC transporter permease [Rhodospirillaceae bacterium]|nr:branched-chain amino acid ABC transporter permease [Rhodospirillaceae bacterium]
MIQANRKVLLFGVMALLLLLVGFVQSWSLALAILNLCLISAVMSLGVNIQWGYAGLFNVGVMGFAALGGLAGVLVSTPPVHNAIAAGGGGILLTGAVVSVTIAAVWLVMTRLRFPFRGVLAATIIAIGFFAARAVFDPAVEAIESVDSAATGFLGGLGLPILFSWIVGGLFAAGAAWVVGKVALGLRADYLAIATLGISEIIVAMLKNEDWLTRGVKNVTGLPRPVPYEVDLQQAAWFQSLAETLGSTPVDLSSITVKLCYALLFAAVLLVIMWLCETALRSPWGRMMRAIRDNPVAAEAMGKDVTRRHLQVFILGSAVIGMAGAMLTTLDGQFTPASYQPLRFTFVIWVMVIVGGSGNNWGAVLGGFLIWFFWVEAEPIGLWIMDVATSGMAPDNPVRIHLLESAAHMRLMTMGLILLLVLRFTPRGLIPEEKR